MCKACGEFFRGHRISSRLRKVSRLCPPLSSGTMPQTTSLQSAVSTAESTTARTPFIRGLAGHLEQTLDDVAAGRALRHRRQRPRVLEVGRVARSATYLRSATHSRRSPAARVRRPDLRIVDATASARATKDSDDGAAPSRAARRGTPAGRLRPGPRGDAPRAGPAPCAGWGRVPLLTTPPAASCPRTLRRSRSLIPPQMPNFSLGALRAYSRQSWHTMRPRHTAFASPVPSPRVGKKTSGLTPAQLA